ncbi:MAG: hypothetical protein C3F02_04750 [Parcubacteria group bacterium]|nr:MAG: hypothetical protein C3F02_04750 [Parcubacteria group bacterium]
MDQQYYVYILASRRNGTIYIGSTDDLEKRVYEHKDKLVKGFTERYNVDKLVYFEIYEHRDSSRWREKQIKKWNRGWKIKLIEKDNPYWKDLYYDL